MLLLLYYYDSIGTLCDGGFGVLKEWSVEALRKVFFQSHANSLGFGDGDYVCDWDPNCMTIVVNGWDEKL